MPPRIFLRSALGQHISTTIETMLKTLPLFALCAACSPANDVIGDTAVPVMTNYATQIDAPSPDYRTLLSQPSQAAAWRAERKATAPFPANAKSIGELWLTRLKKRGVLLGYGLAGKSPDEPVEMIDTGLTEKEFASWTNENGWPVAAHIRWSFVAEMNLPQVSVAAKSAIRVWPASVARTGAQNQALFNGRVELRDGCFFVGQFGEPADKLAWFHGEIGLDRDKAGYYILRERVSGQTLARLGENMSWGGPASAEIEPETKRALQEACGPGEIYVVGSPEASERFLTQYPHLRGPQIPPTPPTTAVQQPSAQPFPSTTTRATVPKGGQSECRDVPAGNRGTDRMIHMGTFAGIKLYGLAGQLVCSEPSGSGVGECELSANSVAIAQAKNSSRALIASSQGTLIWYGNKGVSCVRQLVE